MAAWIHRSTRTNGESHFFKGRRYRLNVVKHDGQAYVRLSNNRTIQLFAGHQTDRKKHEEVFQHWYRQTLQKQIPHLLDKWGARVGVTVNEVRIRRMKTRWGSCNALEGRIWLNLELAKKSPVCLEFILVHEMVHLLERRHNERFCSLMDAVMPNWRLFRDELNRAPLANEKWKY